MSDYKLTLLRGAIVIIDGIHIRQLTIGDIERIGYTRYYGLINMLALDKKDFFSDISRESLDKISIFDMLTREDDICNLFIDIMSILILHDDECPIYYDKGTRDVVVIYNDNIATINRNNIDSILDVLCEMYCVNKEEENIDDVDDEMLKLLKEFKEEEEKIRRSRGGCVTLVSIIEAVSSKHPSLNLFNIWDLTVYQLMSTYHRLNIIDNNTHVMTGIYSGTISSKDINMEKMHWANKI